MYGHLNMALIVKESGSYAMLMSTNSIARVLWLCACVRY